jgi:hypothetical protein
VDVKLGAQTLVKTGLQQIHVTKLPQTACKHGMFIQVNALLQVIVNTDVTICKAGKSIHVKHALHKIAAHWSITFKEGKLSVGNIVVITHAFAAKFKDGIDIHLTQVPRYKPKHGLEVLEQLPIETKHGAITHCVPPHTWK